MPLGVYVEICASGLSLSWQRLQREVGMLYCEGEMYISFQRFYRSPWPCFCAFCCVSWFSGSPAFVFAACVAGCCFHASRFVFVGFSLFRFFALAWVGISTRLFVGVLFGVFLPACFFSVEVVFSFLVVSVPVRVSAAVWSGFSPSLYYSLAVFPSWSLCGQCIVFWVSCPLIWLWALLWLRCGPCGVSAGFPRLFSLCMFAMWFSALLMIDSPLWAIPFLRPCYSGELVRTLLDYAA